MSDSRLRYRIQFGVYNDRAVYCADWTTVMLVGHALRKAGWKELAAYNNDRADCDTTGLTESEREEWEGV
jgi:hypothetical protein